MAKRGSPVETAVDRIRKALPVGAAEDMDGMSEAKLKAEIVQAEETIRELEAEMAGDDKLTGAKSIVKDLAGGYRECLKAQRAVIKYALHCLDSVGRTVTP